MPIAELEAPPPVVVAGAAISRSYEELPNEESGDCIPCAPPGAIRLITCGGSSRRHERVTNQARLYIASAAVVEGMFFIS